MYRVYRNETTKGAYYILVDSNDRYDRWRPSASLAVDGYQESLECEQTLLNNLRSDYTITFPLVAEAESLDELRTILLLKGV